jgi:VPDSG-CTERM motif
MNKIKYIAAILIGIAGLGFQQAKADTFTSDIGSGNTAISAYSGPYANVTITLVNSTTATVTFTSLTNGGNIYLMGDGSSADLNVNASTFSVSGVTSTQLAGFNSGGFLGTSSGNVDGLGSFNLQLNFFDGYTWSKNSISFTLTNTSGTWASASNVLFFNSNGFDAAAHIYVSDGNVADTALATGFAGETGGHIVPDGGTTVMLLGIGLSVLGMARRFLTG